MQVSRVVERCPGAYRNDDVFDRPGDRGRVVCVVHEGAVGRPWHDSMKAVGRQGGHLVLIGHPSLGVPTVSGQDNQWLRSDAAEFPGLGFGPIRTRNSSREPPISIPVAAVVRASSRYLGGRSEKLVLAMSRPSPSREVVATSEDRCFKTL